MDFALFVILNGVLLIRPEELLPDIDGLRLYLIAIALNVFVAAPRLAETLRLKELAARPITVCVLGVWAAGILSQLVRGQIGLAIDFAGEFGKVMLYYLLLVSIIDSSSRLRAFFGWIVAFVVVISTLGLLQHHEVIDIETMRPLERGTNVDPETGERTLIYQLRGTGIYNDPNDLCLILVTGSLCALYRSSSAGGLALRVLWLLPIGLFGYAVMLTQSRGGLLGLLVAAATWAYGRFGWKKGLLICAVLLPGMFFLSSGRQSELSTGSDTAQTRIQVWSEGLVALMRNPLTGIGVHEYSDEVGHVAHNSFVHAYVELGLLGGSLFLWTFALSGYGLIRANPDWNPTLFRLRPFLLAIFVGYTVGIFSLSRAYVQPTYMMLGLAEVYLRMAYPSPPDWLQVDGVMARRLIAVGIVGLIALKVLTQMLLSLG